MKDSNSDINYGSERQPLFLQSITHELRTLKSKQQILEEQLLKLSQHCKSIKKQTKRVLQVIKQQLKDRIRQKVEGIEEILKLLDFKIEFAIQNCEKYSQKIMRMIMNNKNNNSNREEEDQMNKNNSKIIQKINILNEKMKCMQQKILNNKKYEEELKHKIQFLKQKNLQLSQQYNILSINSTQKIHQLQNLLKLKNQQIKKKQSQLYKFSFNSFNHHSQKNNFQQNTIPSNTNLVQPQHQFVSIPTSQQNNNTSNFNHLNNPKIPISSKNLQNSNNTFKSKQSASIKDSNIVNSYINNSIQLKPQYFTGKLIQSNLKQEPDPQGKGIYLKSLIKQNGAGIKVKKLKQSNQLNHNSSRDETHRFDYLINNLVATQIQSTQIFQDSSASITSRQQYMYQTPRS